jgi:CheY-like chemotaxis protein
MTSKLKCILLVDDDSVTNYIHKKHIEYCGVADCIQIASDGQNALDIITHKDEQGVLADKQENFTPDLIFLDINMPKMNGWQFLEAYQRLEEIERSKVIILSTSVDSADKLKAESYESVSEYVVKPLDEAKINNIMSTYF